MSEDYLTANRKLWDQRVAGHVASTFYDVPGFLAGKCSLNSTELSALGDVRGLNILHLQCHFGLDTLSLARRGAVVTGVDFSGEAIAKARELAAAAGLEGVADFVECDVLELADHLEGQYDVVFTSYGALLWLPELVGWAGVVRHFLRPGGKLVVAEFHPYWHTLNWETLQITFPYFNKGEPCTEVSTASYAGDAQLPALTEYFWCHSLSDLMRPLLGMGMVIEVFEEFPYSHYNCFPNLVEVEPGRWMPRGTVDMHLPIMYLLQVRG